MRTWCVCLTGYFLESVLGDCFDSAFCAEIALFLDVHGAWNFLQLLPVKGVSFVLIVFTFSGVLSELFPTFLCLRANLLYRHALPVYTRNLAAQFRGSFSLIS